MAYSISENLELGLAEITNFVKKLSRMFLRQGYVEWSGSKRKVLLRLLRSAYEIRTNKLMEDKPLSPKWFIQAMALLAVAGMTIPLVAGVAGFIKDELKRPAAVDAVVDD